VLEHFTCRGQSEFDKNNKLEASMFVSVSRIYKVCREYATYGYSASRYGGGHVVFFKNLLAYDISGLSSVPTAAEYVTLPKITTYIKGCFNNTLSSKDKGLPFCYGQVRVPPKEDHG
jgi:hypothetical protein